MNVREITNVIFQDVDMTDYPKFCDAYIESAEYKGRPATAGEIDLMNEEGSIFYELLNQYLK